MTALRCDACGRALAADVAFCPYCGADRRPSAPAPAAAPEAGPARLIEAAEPPPPPAEPVAAPAAVPAFAPLSPPEPPEPPVPPGGAPTAPAKPKRTRPPPKRGGCGGRLLVALMLAAAVLAWCAVRAGRSDGPAAVPGATAVQPLHVSRRWRTTPLPGDAPATARFAVSSTVALRVRADGRIYAVRPGHPLRLPDDLGDSIELRAADYVTAQDAARAKTTLSTLRGGG